MDRSDKRYPLSVARLLATNYASAHADRAISIRPRGPDFYSSLFRLGHCAVRFGKRLGRYAVRFGKTLRNKSICDIFCVNSSLSSQW